MPVKESVSSQSVERQELMAGDERQLAARSALCAAVAANTIASLRAEEALAGAIVEILAGDAASLPSAVSRFEALKFEAAELAQERQLLETFHLRLESAVVGRSQ